MTRRFSRKLSPKAKRALLLGEPGERVSCLLQIAPSQDVEALRRDVESFGGTVGSWMKETNLMSVELDASKLPRLAELRGVIHIEAEARYATQ